MLNLSALKWTGSILLLWATAIASHAQTFTSLVSFSGIDGEFPYASLVQGTDGNLYGTTSSGGAFRTGTLFKITPTGTLTTIYSFCALNDCDDGGAPESAPTQATNGKFYGTAEGGPGGVVYEITAAGTETILYSFCSQVDSQGACTDGSSPWGGLVQGNNGNFYGTTEFGGNGVGAFCAYQGCGTVFELNPAGKLTTLYNFCTVVNSQGVCNDGNLSEATLIQASNGNFYGTTLLGGANDRGTVFEITPGGKLTTLHSFCAKVNSRGLCTDGASPGGSLIQATNGNFYGTASGGPANGGIVFEISAAGSFTIVHSFCPPPTCMGGFSPTGLIQATDGNFYGTDLGGGPSDAGTIFKITAGGLVSTLHSFDDTDGQSPTARLLQLTDGGFYGTTYLGGIDGDGTVFKLSVGLSPFVATRPAIGKVGEGVTILGNGLTGTTALSFNGTEAEFTVVTSTEIRTTVPNGATTGIVEVTTPTGTLKSNVVFQVH